MPPLPADHPRSSWHPSISGDPKLLPGVNAWEPGHVAPLEFKESSETRGYYPQAAAALASADGARRK